MVNHTGGILFLFVGTFKELDAFVTHNCTNFGMEKQKVVGDGVVTGYVPFLLRNSF